ncbi:hypothetical protein [Halolamina sp.]|uniref:hypothetical protein n=1 Tax=Halolamina sp. TaxID=1940283 RepID=UPI00356A20D9
MRTEPTHRLLLYSIVLVVTLAGAATPIAAQEGSAPAVTLSAAEIQVDAGETTEVTANYEFTVQDPGSGEQVLSAISGTMWLFPDHGVSDVSATVNGESVEPAVTREDRYMDVALPVSDVSGGETVEATVSYSVTSAPGSLKAPLWTPQFQTAGTDRVIEMTVSLPEGSNVHGAAFPKVDSRSGTTLSYDLLHMPGFVSVDYGQGGGALLDVGTLSTLFGLLLIFGILGGWLAWRRRAVREGGDANVI